MPKKYIMSFLDEGVEYDDFYCSINSELSILYFESEENIDFAEIDAVYDDAYLKFNSSYKAEKKVTEYLTNMGIEAQWISPVPNIHRHRM